MSAAWAAWADAMNPRDAPAFYQFLSIPIRAAAPTLLPLRVGRRVWRDNDGYRLLSRRGRDRGITVHTPPPEPLVAVGWQLDSTVS